MKFKIYDVCKMIYEEQRLAGSRMQQIERKVQALKARFTHQLSKQKGYEMSYDDIESLFEYQTSQSTLLHSEVQSKIKEIKSRHITAQLEEQLKNFSVKDNKENLPANKLAQFVEKPDKSIKEKAEALAYNPLMASHDDRKPLKFTGIKRTMTQFSLSQGLQGGEGYSPDWMLQSAPLKRPHHPHFQGTYFKQHPNAQSSYFEHTVRTPKLYRLEMKNSLI